MQMQLFDVTPGSASLSLSRCLVKTSSPRRKTEQKSTLLEETKRTVHEEKRNNKTENPDTKKEHIKSLRFKSHAPDQQLNSTQHNVILGR
ncbi:hypothetical protein E2C01_075368 [Portunus trituberculatus]|uniref:Uncharacterized protein n=1 Tax=Portunus trituberculatus TaxID=210409 RepID=A0A5B7IEX2_PORTR|nr:hypothetical protein [Portunus trituberculatus]